MKKPTRVVPKICKFNADEQAGAILQATVRPPWSSGWWRAASERGRSAEAAMDQRLAARQPSPAAAIAVRLSGRSGQLSVEPVSGAGRC